MKKILVCRTGAFGDVCMTLPVVHALSGHCEVHWLIRRGHDAVLRLFPEVTCQPVVVERGEGVGVPVGLIARLAAAEYDALLDFTHWDIVATLASRLKDIPVRAIAYDSTRRPVWPRLKNALPWRRPFNTIVTIDGPVHRVLLWQQLVKAALGWRLTLHWPLQPIHVPGPSVRLFVQPHASKPAKVWPIDGFVTVLTRLAEQKATRCFVNQGHPGEHGAAEDLCARLRRAGVAVTPVAFDPSLVSLKEALKQVDFALGLDSGPMHFAALMGVPSIVLYGPYSPAEIAPLWRTVAVTPPAGSSVIQRITPAMVSEAIGKAFSLTFDRSAIGYPQVARTSR